MRRTAIFIAVLLIIGIAVPVALSAYKDDTYKRVVIIGVDGMGTVSAEVPTPNMDRIFANGATTYDMQSVTPSYSGQAWGSMFYGVDPEVHGWDNTNMLVMAYIQQMIKASPRTEKPAAKREPEGIYSLFKLIADKYPQADQAAICYWIAIWAFAEFGVNVYLDGFEGAQISFTSDEYVLNKTLDYLDGGNDPKFLYVHFDNVDYYGHEYGVGDLYRETLTVEDGYIGQIYDKYAELGLLEDTLFIVTTDHGHRPGGNHGGNTPAEMNCFLGVAGKTVKKGALQNVDIKDVAAIVASALNITPPDFWTNKLPEGLF
ncbi:MAG: alkaline phosphatase family protein [Clostridiaceae bacterium]|jgi:predicted AlkP superfamily pyrophosphatase or phosphodiesterase|nr:alkaline phosphatase family protein [Clostridiaceae bacterium]